MSILSSSAHSVLNPRLFKVHFRFPVRASLRDGHTLQCALSRILTSSFSSSRISPTKMTDPKQAGETVVIKDRQYRAVREGRAQILAPYRELNSVPNQNQIARQTQQKKRPYNNDEGNQAVFYNPIQQYNRDLSVLAILTYGEGAVTEKKERWARRGKPHKGKGKKTRPTEGNVKKRRFDELEDSGEAADTKRVRSADREDEDEDLKVQELGQRDVVADDQPESASLTAANGQSAAPKEKPPPFTILDALSASGLRAIRYAKEIPFATNIIANDLSAEAVKAIELNIDHNDVRGKVHSNVGDARAYMYSKIGANSQHPSEAHVARFDVIDLDPYGTAAPFLDAAVQAMTDGGLLCVTCTDAGVFASNGYPEKAFALYGGVTMKGAHSHEAGLRLILNAVATSAARYGIAIEPLLSLSIDFYARIFIRLHKKQQDVKLLAGTTMVTYNCDNGCGAWNTQLVARNQTKVGKGGDTFFKHGFAQAPSISQQCDHCGSKLHLGGPMWAGPLHNPYFVQRILDKLPTLDPSIYGTIDRIRGMLTLALEEDLTLESSNSQAPTPNGAEDKSEASHTGLEIIPRLPPQLLDSAPFFFIPSYLAKVIHCATPGEDPLRGAIRKLGYQVTRSHCKPGSFKTNAPWDVLWEIMREWARREAPIKEGKIAPGTPGWVIMNKMRDTESKRASDLMHEIGKVISKGIDGKEDLRRLLESGLYRLEHGLSTEADKAISIDSKTDGHNTVGKSHDVSKLNIMFDAGLGKEKARGKLVRYQINPRANWGPMSRANGA